MVKIGAIKTINYVGEDWRKKKTFFFGGDDDVVLPYHVTQKNYLTFKYEQGGFTIKLCVKRCRRNGKQFRH